MVQHKRTHHNTVTAQTGSNWVQAGKKSAKKQGSRRPKRTKTFQVPEDMVGKVIGKGGVTVQRLNREVGDGCFIKHDNDKKGTFTVEAWNSLACDRAYLKVMEIVKGVKSKTSPKPKGRSHKSTSSNSFAALVEAEPSRFNGKSTKLSQEEIYGGLLGFKNGDTMQSRKRAKWLQHHAPGQLAELEKELEAAEDEKTKKAKRFEIKRLKKQMAVEKPRAPKKPSPPQDSDFPQELEVVEQEETIWNQQPNEIKEEPSEEPEIVEVDEEETEVEEPLVNPDVERVELLEEEEEHIGEEEEAWETYFGEPGDGDNWEEEEEYDYGDFDDEEDEAVMIPSEYR